jgi:hypothetical protein
MSDSLQHATLTIDRREYTVEWVRRCHAPADAPRLAVVAFLPNPAARRILQVCIDTIKQNTATPYELWVVDNGSPTAQVAGLLEIPGVNVVLSHTQPLPPDQRVRWRQWALRLRGKNQMAWGSYANAVGLEIATRLVDPASRYLMTLHMDSVACHPQWLAYLASKLDDRVAAAGVRLEKARVPAGVLHVLGMLVDFQVMRRLGLDFFPQLPAYDVGDRITVGLRGAGYDVFACANTHTDPSIVQRIGEDSPYASLAVERALDDDSNVIFMHLGRGLPKAANRLSRGVSVAAWVDFAQRYLLA